MIQLIVYCFFRLCSASISRCSYPTLHKIGNILGSCAYVLHRPFRKKALTNLAIAYGCTKSEKERKEIAKKSFQSLLITCLEFFHMPRDNEELQSRVVVERGTPAETILQKNKGVIFLSAHQANWEMPFVAMTRYYRGVAVGRPIKNKRLYAWLLSIRERNQGEIVLPKQAIRAGIQALCRGDFFGIVGDQAHPESSYSYPLLGTRAWTISTPALLAYKTGAPLFAVTTKREKGLYVLSLSEPIWPNRELPRKEEVRRMMDLAMGYLEKSIQALPEQWMWVHDRWKQHTVNHIKQKYRYGFIAIIFPPHPFPIEEVLSILKKIYTRSFLICFVPTGTKRESLGECEVKEYASEQDLLIRDWRFQIVLDFTDTKKVRRHFLRLGAWQVLAIPSPQPAQSWSQLIAHKLVKPDCIPRLFHAP